MSYGKRFKVNTLSQEDLREDLDNNVDVEDIGGASDLPDDSDELENIADTLDNGFETLGDISNLKEVVSADKQFSPASEAYFNNALSMIQKKAGVKRVKKIAFESFNGDKKKLALEEVSGIFNRVLEAIKKLIVEITEFIKGFFKKIYEFFDFAGRREKKVREELVPKIEELEKQLKDVDHSNERLSQDNERLKKNLERLKKNLSSAHGEVALREQIIKNQTEGTKKLNVSLALKDKTIEELKREIAKYESLSVLLPEDSADSLYEEITDTKFDESNDSNGVLMYILACLNNGSGVNIGKDLSSMNESFESFVNREIKIIRKSIDSVTFDENVSSKNFNEYGNKMTMVINDEGRYSMNFEIKDGSRYNTAELLKIYSHSITIRDMSSATEDQLVISKKLTAELEKLAEDQVKTLNQFRNRAVSDDLKSNDNSQEVIRVLRLNIIRTKNLSKLVGNYTNGVSQASTYISKIALRVVNTVTK